MWKHVGEQPHSCKQHNYTSTFSDALQIRMMTHTGKKPLRIIYSLTNVIKFAHKNKHKLQKHKMTHTGEKAHKCNQCLPCVHALSFKIPMRTHMWEKSCKCSQCDYTCTRVANLHTHMLTHTEVNPFNCDQCTMCSL